MTREEPRIKVTLPSADVELPAKHWNRYKRLTSEVREKMLSHDLAFIFGDYLENLFDQGDVLPWWMENLNQELDKLGEKSQ